MAGSWTACPHLPAKELGRSLGDRQAETQPFAPSLGRPVEDLVALPDPMGPVVLWVDNFGNLVTNLEPPIGTLSIGGRAVPGPLRTFADARRGDLFW